MKKLLLTLTLLLSLTAIPLHAQEELPTEPAGEETQIQILEEIDSPVIQEEDTETSEDIQVTQEQNIGFLSILFATITPALLIVIAYLLIKMSNK
jgi:hypothetical protein